MNAHLKPVDNAQANVYAGSTSLTRVLLVDDDPAYRHLCKRYLLDSANGVFEVVEAATGPEALERCRESEFDCFLVDYSLPQMSGVQLLRSLELMFAQPPPAIIMTAGGGETAAAESVRAGAADYLPKRAVSAESLSRAIGNAKEKWQLRVSIHDGHRNLELANQQLKLKNAEINRFYHTVSHEVKTPLTAIREFVAIVADGLVGDVTEEQSEMLRYALESCDQIASHFDDLIELTRFETGKMVVNKELASLDDVVTRCVVAVVPAMQAKDIAFEQNVPDLLPQIEMDSNRIVQVLSNLLGNAVKFTGTGGQVKVFAQLDKSAEEIIIGVQDSGRGISIDDREHVFDRLFQVEGKEDNEMGVGLGLGLTIARDIVSLHGGRMNVESEFGVGSTFSFRLPINGQSALINEDEQ